MSLEQWGDKSPQPAPPKVGTAFTSNFCPSCSIFVKYLEALLRKKLFLHSGKKGAKKEEQYRTMWAELERLVTAHSDQSVKHHAVLECLMEVRQVRSLSFLRLAEGTAKKF
jgi:hypothetical protein